MPPQWDDVWMEKRKERRSLLLPAPVVRSKWCRTLSRLNRPNKLPSVAVRLSISLADPGMRLDGFVGELFILFSLSLSSFVIGLIEEANDKALNELLRDTSFHRSRCLLYKSREFSPHQPRFFRREKKMKKRENYAWIMDGWYGVENYLTYFIFTRFLSQFYNFLVPGRIVSITICCNDFIVNLIRSALLKSILFLLAIKSWFEIFPVFILNILPLKMNMRENENREWNNLNVNH